MTEMFCKNCKKMTSHKSLMCRRQEAESSFTQKCTQFFIHVAKGNHYYDMEPRFFCRSCNCQTLQHDATAQQVAPPSSSHVNAV